MTEKDYTPKKNEVKKMVVDTQKKSISNTPIKKAVETPKENIKKVEEKKEASEKKEKPKEESKKDEIKKPVETKPKVKKTQAVVNASDLHISTKHSVAVCKFIKGKKIEGAIDDLEKVIIGKKPVPMKGEIPHQKGIMSGRFPKKAAQHFVKLLKNLSTNANFHEIENPVITEAIANIGSRPYGKFGRVRRKRTHIKIVAKKISKKKKEKEIKK